MKRQPLALAHRVNDPIRPIRLPGFTLHATGVKVEGRPSFAEWQAAVAFAERADRAAAWWIADLTKYAEHRADFEERMSQAMAAGGITFERARKIKYVGENVALERRRTDLDFSLHEEVAALTPKEQTHWLGRAAEKGWSKRDLRIELRAAHRQKVIEGQAVLEGQFRVIYADPPWRYGDALAGTKLEQGGAAHHYPSMTIEELCKLPVAAHAMPNSVLFLWTTTPFLLLNPGPREVIEAWGYVYKSELAWDKVLGMPGHYGLEITHEHLLICTRGDGQPDVPLPLSKSVLVERRSDTHSEKPESVRQWIMRHWTKGPHLELFGRKRAEGWSVFGNDARLWLRDASRSA